MIPVSSKTDTDMAKKAYAQLPSLCKKLSVRVVWDLHVDPKNKTFMLFEAPSADAVKKLITTTGLVNILDVNFHLVKIVEGFPTRQLHHDGQWKRCFS